MRRLTEVRNEPLIWTETGAFSRVYRLVHEDEQLAALRIAGFGDRRSSAESAEGRWNLRREHWFSPHVIVTDAASGRSIARFEGRWFGGGTLSVEGGESFEWRFLSYWRSERGFVRENGEPAVRFRKLATLEASSLFRKRATLTIEPDRISERELAVMAVLGWYLVVRAMRRSAQ